MTVYQLIDEVRRVLHGTTINGDKYVAEVRAHLGGHGDDEVPGMAADEQLDIAHALRDLARRESDAWCESLTPEGYLVGHLTADGVALSEDVLLDVETDALGGDWFAAGYLRGVREPCEARCACGAISGERCDAVSLAPQREFVELRYVHPSMRETVRACGNYGGAVMVYRVHPECCEEVIEAHGEEWAWSEGPQS